MVKKITIIKQKINKKLLVFYWREQFIELKDSTTDFDLTDLSKYDPFFLTAKGKAALSNVRRAIAGLYPTMQVVQALKCLIKEREKDILRQEHFIKKQKLVMT